jgi:hypothetical protein
MILSQPNSVSVHTSYMPKINFNIISFLVFWEVPQQSKNKVVPVLNYASSLYQLSYPSYPQKVVYMFPTSEEYM